MLVFALSLLSLGILISILVLENFRVRKARKKIPLRILINGTRGKSEVTRLIHTMLRNLHFKPLGKVSGTIPMWLLPDGRQERSRRLGPGNVYEMFKALFKACRSNCDSLVVECMAITPELEKVCGRVVNPQVTVITNAFVDHPELGETESETMCSLLESIPDGSVCIIPEDVIISEKVVENLKNRKIKLKVARASEELNSLAAHLKVFESNLALAVETLICAGLSYQQLIHALRSMRTFDHDIGSFGYFKLSNGSILANAFAANDLVSTERLLAKAVEDYPDRHLVGFLNLRRDRAFRTLRMLEILQRWHFRKLFTNKWCHRMITKVYPNVHILRSPKELTRYTTSKDLIFGFGNIKGLENWLKEVKAKDNM